MSYFIVKSTYGIDKIAESIFIKVSVKKHFIIEAGKRGNIRNAYINLFWAIGNCCVNVCINLYDIIVRVAVFL